MIYIWQYPDWPAFVYDVQSIEDSLFAFAEQTGHMSGILKAMPENVQMEAIINTMAAEAIKTSEIEGEYFSRADIISFIRNHLGLDTTNDPIKNKYEQGAGELMVDVRKTYAEVLTVEKLFAWH